MTYYNGNPYEGPTADAPLDRFAHDACLPDSEFTTYMLADLDTGHIDPETGFTTWDKVPHRQQNWPWHWSPVWGAPEPCYVCGRPVK
jgi:hypothetical protein